MKQIITNLSKRKMLLLLAIVVSFCCMVFFWLGGGKVARRGKDVVAGGLNKELPRAIIDGKQLLNKKLQYEQAARDSLRKAQFQRQDPYRRDTSVKLESALGGRDAMKDPRAEQLLRQLDQLKASLHRPQAEDEGHARTLPAFRWGVRSAYQGLHAFGGQDDTT